jgi:hypothetical protein
MQGLNFLTVLSVAYDRSDREAAILLTDKGYRATERKYSG